VKSVTGVQFMSTAIWYISFTFLYTSETWYLYSNSILSQTIYTVSIYNTQCNRNSLLNITAYSVAICFIFRRFLAHTWPRDRFFVSSLSPYIQIPAQYFKLYQNHFLPPYFQCIILHFSYCLMIYNLSCLKCC